MNDAAGPVIVTLYGAFTVLVTISCIRIVWVGHTELVVISVSIEKSAATRGIIGINNNRNTDANKKFFGIFIIFLLIFFITISILISIIKSIAKITKNHI